MLTSQNKYPKTLSFEFFPPKTDKGVEKLRVVAKELASLGADYFSVTHGAGGSGHDQTTETVLDLSETTKIPMAPHLSCIGASKKKIKSLINTYENHNINRLVALRGDLPAGISNSGELKHASELVSFIRETTGDYFHIEVAAYPEFHPEAHNSQLDLHYFKEKVENGANGAITQYFFNIDAYLFFIENCEERGINIPIVPGIMPIYNCVQLERFSDICGAELPRWIRKKLENMQDDEQSTLEFGIDVVTELCDKLLTAGAPGIHFYTLNRADVSTRICQNIDVISRIKNT